MSTTRPLDHFEQSLLAELRSHVARRGAAPAPRRRRLAAAGAGVLAAASIGVGAIVLRPDPSFAVTQEANGDVVVTLTRLDDAAGLVRALAEHGVEAEVGSDPGRSSLEIRAEDAAPGQKDTVTPGEPAASAPLTCDLIGVETPPSGGVSFRLPAAAVDADVPLLIQGDAGDDYSSITVAWEDSVC